VIEVHRTAAFQDWLDRLRDAAAARKIAIRIARVEAGLFGDVMPVGDGISELRIDHGPGYRLYFVRRGQTLIILLCGGNKGSQQRDIRCAKKMAREV
jgi:putative addiction module killer protein